MYKSKYHALQKINCLITSILQLEGECRFCTDSLVFKKWCILKVYQMEKVDFHISSVCRSTSVTSIISFGEVPVSTIRIKPGKKAAILRGSWFE